MHIPLLYGKRQVRVWLPDASVIAIASPPRPILPAENEAEEIRRALTNPIESPRLRDLAAHKSRPVIIAPSDHQRGLVGRLVSHLLREMEEVEIPPSRVSVVTPGGNHPPAMQQKRRSTQGRSPAWLHRDVVEADLRIFVSEIEPHQSASRPGADGDTSPWASVGGVFATRCHVGSCPEACIAALEGRFARQYLGQMASRVGLDFLLQVLLTDSNEVSKAFAGQWTEVCRASVEAVSEHICFFLQERADIVLASVGGTPSDSDLWRTEECGLSHVSQAVRNGGVIVMLAECAEGVGHPGMEEALSRGTLEEILATSETAEGSPLREMICRLVSLLEKADLYLVTRLDPRSLDKIPIRVFDSPQDAVQAAFEKMGPLSKVVVVPKAAGVLLCTR